MGPQTAIGACMGMDLCDAAPRSMDLREAEDRLVALEALTTGLIRTLRGAGLLREVQVEELLTGRPGATFAAQQLAASVDPDGSGPAADAMREAHLCASFRRVLYRHDETLGL